MNRPERLSQGFCRSVQQPGRYGDGRGGNGLSLLVKERAHGGGGMTKSWLQQLRRRDRSTVNLGLGSLETVTLQRARERALENAQRLRRGEEVRQLRGLPTAAPTLRSFAEEWFNLHRSGWKTDANERTIRQRLGTHAATLVDRPITAIARKDVMGALLKMEGATTRDRLFRNLRDIFNFAIVSEWRNDNPADDAVRTALATRGRQPTKHRAALPVGEIAAVLAKVDAHANWSLVSLALRFVALTACRSGEALGARWDEVDLTARTWTIPAERMKSSRPFVVPLSGAAIALLDRARALADGGPFVFPSTVGKPMDATRLSKAMATCSGATVHGLRSSFRTWAAEAGIQREVAEMVLAHALGSATELAYQRSDFFVARTAVMERWAAVVEGREEHGKVVELDSRRA